MFATRIILATVACLALPTFGLARGQISSEHVKDLSLLVSPELPCVWPSGMIPLAVTPQRPIGPDFLRRDAILIDEHTGTQWDAPAHFVPPPDSGLPGAGPNGLLTSEKVPAWQFCGEACVIDVSEHVDEAEKGASYLIGPEIVQAWEKANRPLRFGDVVLFKSGYSDRYYRPFPTGDRFVATALAKRTPGWPAPRPETMTYLGSKGVMTLGLDGASMGPLPDLAAATHQAGGKLGMIWTECAINLGSLPATGAFYAMLAPKHAGGSGGECRSIAITEPKTAARLIESVRNKRVVDLSVTLDENYPLTWPGRTPGEAAYRYVPLTVNYFGANRGPFFAKAHVFDGQAGTHVLLPSSSLPPFGSAGEEDTPEESASAAAYESRFGKRGRGTTTLEEASLHRMMGEARVIDARELVGTAGPGVSPKITLEILKAREGDRPFRAGEVVIFRSGYSDAHFKPLPNAPELDRLFAAPLAGKAEGWPAPTPEAIAYLADKGVSCVGTDGPTLGGTDVENASTVARLAGSRNLLVIEYLTNVGEIQDKPAFFLFAPIKLKGSRGGYGRAIALY